MIFSNGIPGQGFFAAPSFFRPRVFFVNASDGNPNGRNGHGTGAIDLVSRVDRLARELAADCNQIINEGRLYAIDAAVKSVWQAVHPVSLRLLTAQRARRGQ